MKYLALSVPNPGASGGNITIAPAGGVPTPGIFTANEVIQAAITGIFVLASVLCIIFIIYSGIQWIISGGDAKQIEGARQRLLYAIIGLIIVFASFGVVSFINQLLVGTPSSGFEIPGGNTNVTKTHNDHNNIPAASFNPRVGIEKNR